jgi:hypothetical protein
MPTAYTLPTSTCESFQFHTDQLWHIDGHQLHAEIHSLARRSSLLILWGLFVNIVPCAMIITWSRRGRNSKNIPAFTSELRFFPFGQPRGIPAKRFAYESWRQLMAFQNCSRVLISGPKTGCILTLAYNSAGSWLRMHSICNCWFSARSGTKK